MSFRTIILLLLSLPLVIVLANIGIDAGPFVFVASTYGAATLIVTTIVSIIADKKANKAKESVMPIAIITLALAILATPASAFAQVIQESDMISDITTSIISNFFCAIVTVAVLSMVANLACPKLRKPAMTASAIGIGAALLVGGAVSLLPYTTTGMVGQDMVAIAIFLGVVIASSFFATMRIVAILAIIILPNTAFAATTQETHMDPFYFLLTTFAGLIAGLTILLGITAALEARKARKAAAAYAAAAPTRAAEELAYRQGLDAQRLAAYWQKAENANTSCNNTQILVDFHIGQSSIWGKACYSYVNTLTAIEQNTGLTRALWLK